MIYKEYQDLKLSALGLGCMRLPVIEGNNENIDQDAVQEMVDYSMAQGVNYYDTAWGYHGGHSEIAIGKALAKHPRESFYLADKFPGYDVTNMDKVKTIFEEQLKKCGVEYFDFYLFHNVCEKNINEYLDPKFGIYEYLMEQKRNGRIRHLGFSTHGTTETVKRFLDAYGKDMEFCQIQLNYLDYKMQQADERVELLNQWNIPIWVMEPVRGGKLAELAPEYMEKLEVCRPGVSAVEWAFRFLQSVNGVTVTLSGMSNMEQLSQNIATYKEEKPLTEAEMETLLRISDDMTSKTSVPCTACRYCTERCPQELNIPELIALYNDFAFSKGGFVPTMRISMMAEEKRPSACLGCRSCEDVCPQQIEISKVMSDFAEGLKKL